MIVGTKKNTKSSSYAEWRIEKRPLSNLATLTKFGTSNLNGHSAFARGIALDAGSIYIVGAEEYGFFDTAWRIEKRKRSVDPTEDLSLDSNFGQGGVILENPSFYDDQPSAIAIDGTFMYAGGYSATVVPSEGSADTEWRIEKRLLSDGRLDLLTGFGNYSGIVVSDICPGDNDRARAITVDSSSIYVAGYDNPGLSEWRIEKRDLIYGSSSLLVPLSGQNTNPTVSEGQQFRLRMLLHVDSGTLLQVKNEQFKLQFFSDGNNWEDVADGSAIAFWHNPTPYNGDATLGNSEDPTHGDPIRYQTYVQENCFTNSVSNIEASEDGMWDFSLIVNVAGTYEFRIVGGDSCP
jgi:hypothetical protein